MKEEGLSFITWN